jgi:hypothetical protein
VRNGASSTPTRRNSGRSTFSPDQPSRIRPALDLLIKCKQSDLPYVFFLASHRTSLPDVVHKDFFETYVTDHTIPFAERASQKALKHAVEIVTGEAFVPKLGDRWWEALAQMTPRTTLRKVAHPLTIGRHLVRLFARRD